MRNEDHWPRIDLPLPSPPAEFPPQKESKIPSFRLFNSLLFLSLFSQEYIFNTLCVASSFRVPVAICDLSS